MVGYAFPTGGGGLYHFDSPRTFSACEAVLLGDAADACPLDPKEIIMMLQIKWGRLSAHQLKWVSVGSDGNTMGLVKYADEVMAQCEIRRACDRAPHISTAGNSAVSSFCGK